MNLPITAFITLTLGLPGMASQSSAATEQEKPAPPNILLIMVDDISPDLFGAYGNPTVKTPHLDKLAETGVRFNTAWATPMCSSTRTLLATGRYPDKTGMWHNDFRIQTGEHSPLEFASDHQTFARALREYGYRTAIAGNIMSLGGDVDSDRVGFDEHCYAARSYELPGGQTFDGPSEGAYDIPGAKSTPSRYWHPCVIHDGKLVETGPDDFGPDLYTDFLIDFMARNRTRPFLAYYPMCLVHTTAGGKLPTTPVQGIPGKNEGGELERVTEYVDVLVGRLVEALDQLGLRENTLIIFTADNGTQGKGKIWAMEEGPRVPMIINSPNLLERRGATDELTEFSDIFPTLLDFAGAQVSEGYVLDGKSLKPFLRGASDHHRDFIFSYIATARMIRNKDWLLEAVDPVYATDEGRLFRCAGSSQRSSYEEVTQSSDPEVLAARIQLTQYLAVLPKLDFQRKDVSEELDRYRDFPFRHTLPGARQVSKLIPGYYKEPAESEDAR